MRKQVLGITLPICLAILIAGAFLASAGDLNPPPGPIGPTMKTLDQIEPGIPIDTLPGAADAVRVISQLGRYYLTGDLLGEPGKHGIKVTADGDVSIAGNGFALVGVPGSLSGIKKSLTGFDTWEDTSNLVIRGWGGAGIDATGVPAMDVRDVFLVNNQGGGVLVGPRAFLARVMVEQGGGPAFDVGSGSMLSECTAMLNTGAGMVIDSDTTVYRCMLGDNTGTQLLVTGSGNRVESSSFMQGPGHAAGPALWVQGPSNLQESNTVHIENPGGIGILLDGEGNRVAGGNITIAATAVNAIGIRSNGLLSFIEQDNIHKSAVGAVGIDVVAGTGTTIRGCTIRGSATGGTAIRVNASAAVIERNNVILLGGGSNGIDVTGGGVGHSIVGNRLLAMGGGSNLIQYNGSATLVQENDLTVLGASSMGIMRLGGTTGQVTGNQIRLNSASATGMTIAFPANDLVTNNTITGPGTWYNLAAGNRWGQIVTNPGQGFQTHDVANLAVGP